MAHEHEGQAVRVGGFQAVVARFFHGGSGDGHGHGFLIGVDHLRVAAHFAQQGLRHGHGFKLVLIVRQGLHQFVIFRAMHQMGGLHHQGFDAVGHGAVQGLAHVVDFLTVAGLHMIDDDLGGKGAAHGPIGIGCLQRLFDGADIGGAALIEGSAKGHHQQFLFADLIGVQRIIQAGVAGIAAKVIGVGLFAFHQFLLFVGQGVPGSLGGGDLGVGFLGPLLDVNGVDQLGHGVCGGLISIFSKSGGQRKHHRQGNQTGKNLFHGFILLIAAGTGR